jgi:hypothetical protein
MLVVILLEGFELHLYRPAEKEMRYDKAFPVLHAEKEQ